MQKDQKIAYFSMEIGLEPHMPTYSGGLGVLAGDTIRSAADLRVPMVAVTLIHRKGYFFQKLDTEGWQSEEPEKWVAEDYLKEMDERVSVTIEGRTVHLRAWMSEVKSDHDFVVPVYFLDADLPDNAEDDRKLTDHLYGGDLRYRLCQEVILGVGGVRMLEKIGYDQIQRYHMNEGHVSLLTMELLDQQLGEWGKKKIDQEMINIVRKKCVFTTHTPVEAGHDKFPLELAYSVLGDHPIFELKDTLCCDDKLNMTYLALQMSHYVNGVAKKHGQISSRMFSTYTIDSITNGVHAGTWMSEPFRELFDRLIPGWREDNFSLRYCLSIPRSQIWQAHVKAKEQLFNYVNRHTNAGFDADHLTLGFARRATAYKRATLMFQDLDRLKQIVQTVGPFQILFAGKAHPKDLEGKELIHRIFKAADALKDHIKIAFLVNYDMDVAKLMTAGVDLWVNTPLPPMEASGTSGMKSALNGVPSLSVLDGWWIEGCIEGITGWAVGKDTRMTEDEEHGPSDVSYLYDKLQNIIIPMYYNQRDEFINIMRYCIALNGSFFNTQRMMQQYVLEAYFR